MRNSFRVVQAALLIIALSSCTLQPVARGDLSSRPIEVVTTVGMIADVVGEVGGERVHVTGLMGPGVDPHLYKPSAGDVLKLDRADIIFYGGLHLEGRMAEMFEKLVDRKATVAVTERIDPSRLHVTEVAGKYDPHVWFDVTLWQEAVRTIAQELGAIDPGSRVLYERNATRYLAELDELDRYAAEQIGSIPVESRVLITAHDAFGYFGARYGIEVRGLQGISTAAETGAADVQSLAAMMCDRNIRALFVESSVPRAMVEAVQSAAQARGCAVGIGGELFSDALGSRGTPEGTYIGMVRHNVDTIVQALK